MTRRHAGYVISLIGLAAFVAGLAVGGAAGSSAVVLGLLLAAFGLLLPFLRDAFEAGPTGLKGAWLPDADTLGRRVEQEAERRGIPALQAEQAGGVSRATVGALQRGLAKSDVERISRLAAHSVDVDALARDVVSEIDVIECSDCRHPIRFHEPTTDVVSCEQCGRSTMLHG